MVVASNTARLLLATAAALCFGAFTTGSGSTEPTNSPATPTYAPAFDASAFGGPVDNPFFSLEPGTTRSYTGTKEGDPIRIDVAVTSDRKTILGVDCIVVRDRVTLDGQLVEDTLDWFAQDDQGNVWYFGEASVQYEDGASPDTSGSWEAGVDGALPGIMMPASPAVGDAYQQEFYPGEAEGQARVIADDEEVTVPFGQFTDVLVIEETSPLDLEEVEHKLYAAGVGLVLAEAVAGESEHIELVAVEADGA